MQYQLQYDNEDNASLKTMDATPTRKVSEGTFEVSEYFAPRIDYGIDETYADKFSPEKQLEEIQKKLLLILPSPTCNALREKSELTASITSSLVISGP